MADVRVAFEGHMTQSANTAPFLRIGSRGSPLALVQAREVQGRLAAAAGVDSADIEIKKIKETISRMKDVKDFHHIHIWALSTTENALTAHLVVDRNTGMDAIEQLKHQIKHELLHQKIQHATLEIEMEDAPCKEPDC